jgi:type I restriction enzyme M protein
MKYIEFLKSIGFVLQNGSNQKYSKSYNNYEIICDIERNLINYGDKIVIHRSTTSNFNQQENLVVLECVDKLLTMDYKPETIELEKAYGSGRKEKGQFLDIILKKEDGTAFALIECKTFGEERNKERIKMEKSGRSHWKAK